MSPASSPKSRPSNPSDLAGPLADLSRVAPDGYRAAINPDSTSLNTAYTNAGHRTTINIDGKPVDTLADLLRPGLLAVVVGINPAPPSVAAGHYWQGQTGRTLWRRLKTVGLLPADVIGYEDDAAFEAGIGFTDVVKRPTSRADELSDADLSAGRAALEAKLTKLGVPLVIFAFKKAAVTLLGPFPGNGFIDGASLGASRVFVMPGPYEARSTADPTLASLADWIKEAHSRPKHSPDTSGGPSETPPNEI